MKKIVVLLLLALGLQQGLHAQKVLKVWVVRHAEKDTSNPKDQDPDLSDIGAKRAEALKKELKGQRIDSIFSTDYKRTKLTGYPLADITGINIKTYDPSKIAVLAKSLKMNAQGKKILIIGHSNTVLEVIEAFGGKKPIEKLTDADYSYLFSLTIKGAKVDVKVEKYGDKEPVKEL
jgi:phosphohistidine phosphatase SixA